MPVGLWLRIIGATNFDLRFSDLGLSLNLDLLNLGLRFLSIGLRLGEFQLRFLQLVAPPLAAPDPPSAVPRFAFLCRSDIAAVWFSLTDRLIDPHQANPYS